jgi:4-amino-4-deoxy-L-arabinose transferase-like glycosyltransferase
LLLLALAYWPLFGNLNKLPIRIWDESRAAVNAFEMMKSGELIVTTFEGMADDYCVKPPVLIWFQALSLKLFGVNEIGVRLPSALAGLFTCFLLFFFLRKYLKSNLVGVFAFLVLLTINGYINRHVTRTGDYDALLTLFITSYCLLFFTWIETRQRKYILPFFLFVTLAVLTKSIAGLLIGPALLAYVLYRKSLLPLLKTKEFYLGTIFFLVCVGGYYFLREKMQPGYLELVWRFELGGRYGKTLNIHSGPPIFYLMNLIKYRMGYWVLFVPLSLILIFTSSNVRLKRIGGFSALCAVIYLLVVSGGQTKLEWYDAPAFPFLSITIAIGLYRIFNLVKDSEGALRFKKSIFTLLFVALIFILPYFRITQKIYKSAEYSWETEFFKVSYLFRNANQGKIDLDGYHLVYEDYHAHLDFYILALKEKGVTVHETMYTHLQKGDIAIVSQWPILDKIQKRYNFTLLEKDQNVHILQIESMKK